MKRKKLLIIIAVSLPALLLVLTLTAYFSVKIVSRPYVTGNIDELEPVKTGLVLGTSRTLGNGYKNAYFYNRIDAAVELYNAGKIKYIIVSGDNGRKDYNEPEEMMKELVKRGIPKQVIFSDYAGFRTLDSVIRARDIFGQNTFIIISQKFHNERAVFIARMNGIEAYGYNAVDVNKYSGIKTNIREFLARDKVYFDMIFGVDPKFSGDKIAIE